MSALRQEIAIENDFWQWHHGAIRYQHAGTRGDPVILIHGFGASSDHWRKNIPALAAHHRVYALDLLGFGLSAKPTPGESVEYRFETWAEQVIDFCKTVVGEPAFLIGNSIGCIVALQAAVMDSPQIRGVVMLNCSLRLLHERKRDRQPLLTQWFTPWVQAVLGYKPIGHLFFNNLAKPQTVRNVLKKAYARQEAVTDELVEMLLRPARDPGAADVFIAFIQYASGPLAEDLLPQLQCPIHILWGCNDPWEPVALGRELANYPCVRSLVELEGVGHCPQDEAPEQVNPILIQWLRELLNQ